MAAMRFLHTMLRVGNLQRSIDFYTQVLGMPDVYAACEKIKAAGGNVTREAGPVKGGSTVIAFVTDPDGYKIELIQRAEAAGGAGLR